MRDGDEKIPILLQANEQIEESDGIATSADRNDDKIVLGKEAVRVNELLERTKESVLRHVSYCGAYV